MANLNNIRSVSVPSVGKLPLSEKPGTFTPSGVKRTHKPGREAADGGFIEEPTPAKLELNINVLAGVDPLAVNNIAGETVTVRLANGQNHIMKDAYVLEPLPLDGEGMSKLTIVSNTSEKM